MSLNYEQQQQQEKDVSFNDRFSIVKDQVVRRVFSDQKEKAFTKNSNSNTPNSLATLPPDIDCQIIRRHSTSSISKQVGSNKFFITHKK